MQTPGFSVDYGIHQLSCAASTTNPIIRTKKKKKKYGKPRKLCYRQCTALLSQICQVKQGILHKPFQKYLLNLQSSVSLVYHDCFSPYCLAFLLDKKAWFMPLTSRTSIMIARKLSLIKVIPSCSEYAVSSQWTVRHGGHGQVVSWFSKCKDFYLLLSKIIKGRLNW